MALKQLTNKLSKKTPLLMSPFGFALVACGGGGSKQSEEFVSSQPPSAKLKSSLHSFQESESSEGWWYAGEYNSPQLISYFPQAVGIVDIASDGDLDVIIPLNKGYRTNYMFLDYILRYNRETVLYTAVALRKLHGICSTRSTALLRHPANASFVQKIFHITE